MNSYNLRRPDYPDVRRVLARPRHPQLRRGRGPPHQPHLGRQRARHPDLGQTLLMCDDMPIISLHIVILVKSAFLHFPTLLTIFSVPEAPGTELPAPVAPGRGGLLSCPVPRGASCRRRGWGGGRAAGARSGSSGAAPAPPAARGWGHHPAARVTGGYRCTGESCQLTDPPTLLRIQKYIKCSGFQIFLTKDC